MDYRGYTCMYVCMYVCTHIYVRGGGSKFVVVWRTRKLFGSLIIHYSITLYIIIIYHTDGESSLQQAKSASWWSMHGMCIASVPCSRGKIIILFMIFIYWLWKVVWPKPNQLDWFSRPCMYVCMYVSTCIPSWLYHLQSGPRITVAPTNTPFMATRRLQNLRGTRVLARQAGGKEGCYDHSDTIQYVHNVQRPRFLYIQYKCLSWINTRLYKPTWMNAWSKAVTVNTNVNAGCWIDAGHAMGTNTIHKLYSALCILLLYVAALCILLIYVAALCILLLYVAALCILLMLAYRHADIHTGYMPVSHSNTMDHKDIYILSTHHFFLSAESILLKTWSRVCLPAL